MFFAIAGYPQWNPLTYQIPGGAIISTNASWVFDNVPSDFIGAPGSDGTGTHTPCYQCYMRRMDSIAQTAYNSQSGECFGMCNGTISIRWDQIYMGQITSYSITNNGNTLNDTIKVSGENWYGGTQYFPDQTRVQSSPANLPANSINFDFEGLNMLANGSYPAAGSFAKLIPIPSPSPRPVPSPDPCHTNPRLCV
jgi:hypothetical protein